MVDNKVFYGKSGALRHIYFDATSTLQAPFTSGIQRVVRQLGKHLAAHCARAGIAFDLVYFDGARYCQVPLEKLDTPPPAARLRTRSRWRWLFRLVPQPVKTLVRIFTNPLRRGPRWHGEAGAALILADATWNYQPWKKIARMKEAGTAVYTLVYDLLPINHPAFFTPALVDAFRIWWQESARLSTAYFCISEAVKRDVDRHLTGGASRPPAYVIPLGYDFKTTMPAGDVQQLVSGNWEEGPVILMVGTIEPRKNYAFALDAFDAVWQKNPGVKLVIVGRRGWLSEKLAARITAHPLRGRSLFWLDDCSDENLHALYAHVDTILAASIDEGYGLPIIEAEANGVAVLASDIPVFREIASDETRFYRAGDKNSLVEGILATPKRTARAPIRRTRWPQWAESAETVFRHVYGEPGRA